MAIDPNRPLLRLEFSKVQERKPGKPAFIAKPSSYDLGDQKQKFGPKFDRLAEVLTRDQFGLELRSDPNAIAPERMIVFILKASVQNFASALRRVPGMELIDEEALDADEEDKNPIMFLVVPDARALKEMLSLWQRWQSGAPKGAGYTAWCDVFNTLRELRVWGPQDRVHAADREYIQEQLSEANGAKIRLEVELVFRSDDAIASKLQSDFEAALIRKDGTVVTQSRIKAIGYHALLVEVETTEVAAILALSPASIVGYDLVMHIRPQSVTSKLVASDIEPASSDNSVANGSPILALIDGVPVAQHSLLAGALIVDDQFDLESSALLTDRIHGTAMASLIVHGDRNRNEMQLPRKIHVVPVLGKQDEFPAGRLIVDMVYQVVLRLRGGMQPTAPGVLIVNI